LERKGGFSRLVSDLASAARGFFGTAPNSLKSHLNKDELVRITITSLATGGGIFGLLQAIVVSAGVIFPAPTDAALAATILAALLDVLRRLGHGRVLEPTTAQGPHASQRTRIENDRD
jgi:hypothetical protein